MSDTALTLKAARAEKNLGQSELAYIADISQTTISFIENGVVKPRKSTKDKIEQVVGSVDWRRTFDNGQVRRQVIQN